jgi:hypothetical protein
VQRRRAVRGRGYGHGVGPCQWGPRPWPNSTRARSSALLPRHDAGCAERPVVAPSVPTSRITSTRGSSLSARPFPEAPPRPLRL